MHHKSDGRMFSFSRFRICVVLVDMKEVFAFSLLHNNSQIMAVVTFLSPFTIPYGKTNQDDDKRRQEPPTKILMFRNLSNVAKMHTFSLIVIDIFGENMRFASKTWDSWDFFGVSRTFCFLRPAKNPEWGTVRTVILIRWQHHDKRHGRNVYKYS